MNKSAKFRILLGVGIVAVLAGVLVFANTAKGDAETATDETANDTQTDGTASGDDTANTNDAGDTSVAKKLDLPILVDQPELVDLDGWLQTEADSLDDFDGKVKIVQFWTFSCENCTATIANLKEINDKYVGKDFDIIGVHAAEFEFEKDPDAIAEAAVDLGVSWPIALDTNKKNFHAWQEGPKGSWPRTYVIDENNKIRYDHVGEGKYDELQQVVAQLIEEKNNV